MSNECTKAAMDLFDASAKITGLTGRDKLLLRISAILHESGKYVHARAHNEAAYALIKYTDLIGLNSEELDIIALVVRLYPKQNPYENNYYQKLAPYKKVLVSKLTAILRIADALDSSHKQKSKKLPYSSILKACTYRARVMPICLSRCGRSSTEAGFSKRLSA